MTETIARECLQAGAPLGATVLYLRGSMNNWAALEDYAFRFDCDAYYLNVELTGRHEFKIGDEAWKPATTLGAGTGAYLAEGGGNVERVFSGEHTLRLAWAGGRPELSIGARTFAGVAQQVVSHPLALSLRFDSRAAAHKRPFGAVVAGKTIHFEVQAQAGVQALTLVVETRRLEGNQEVLAYTELARVPMQAQSRPRGPVRWRAQHQFAAVGVYGYWFEALIDGQTYVLQNNRQSIHWTRERGSGGAGEVGYKPANLGGIRRFRQTVYDKNFSVPKWAPDIVYYYVFPERFRNGNPANDPQPGVARYRSHTVELHRQWTEKPFRPGSGDGSDAVYNNDFFGGDLQGLIDKLPYLRELGANTLYMTPVFQAPSNHKYDTADYTRIDPMFGSNADFERLTRQGRRFGMRVIPDTSLNHVGSDSIYFDRYGNHGTLGAFEGGSPRPESPYAEWFSFDLKASEPDKQYKGWVGVSDLPEINKASPSFRRFAYGAPDSVMKLWLDRGAAGWRMDVAPWVPDDFWREWRAAIRSHRADALTVAETWFDSSKYLLGDMFDSTMNYIFRNAVLDWAAGGSARVMMENLEHVREAYPPQAHSALMNLLSTHDQPRALHHVGWRDEARDSPEVVTLAKQRLLLAVFFQMTYPGSPTVYYGDEVGVTGGEDPYNRATYPWADLGGQPDLALLAEFKRLIALRHQHAVLRRGSLSAPALVDEQAVASWRRLGQQWALVVASNAAEPRRIEVALPPGAPSAWAEVMRGGTLKPQNGRLVLTVPARSGALVLSR
jgi:cyclomaltodextrinase / maltogenic alpha-amylase / neopullulanase